MLAATAIESSVCDDATFKKSKWNVSWFPVGMELPGSS